MIQERTRAEVMKTTNLADTPDIAYVARSLGDPSRLRILRALLDGRAYSATMLAMEAGIAPSTASAHLGQLVEAGLLRRAVTPPREGRYRYYELAGHEVADLYEALATVTPAIEPASTTPGTPAYDLRRARLCYDHLAGRIGVALMSGLIDRAWLAPHDAGYALTPVGERQLERFGIDLAGLRRGRRRLIRTCADWSEQRPHLSGALGSALRAEIERRDWVERSGLARVLTITPAGRDGFRQWFGAALSD